ncbi:MAG: YgeY family selenium metabolism-linked hydrolase [Caldilineaceae bacterium]|nr:YgeY family selenium metabolism-linked hydrolase [Caldilineaceae bacterium]
MIQRDRLISFTRDLVRLPSLSGEEDRVAARVQAEMEALGYDRVWTDANGSVAGIIEGARPGKTLLLDAHTDTVGISPGVAWQHEPFGAEVDGDAIYGRGAADMKGALAAMVHAAAASDRSRLQGRVVVSASTMEEVLEGVALQAVMEQTSPDFVVIGEATDLQISRGGRGRAEVHLTTTGRPSHSSAPQLGRNAVLDMMRVIAAVEKLELSTDPLMGPAIFALTDIISEPYPGHSVIPSICKVTYDRRLLPGETVAGVLAPLSTQHELAGIDLKAEIGIGAYRAFTGAQLRCEKFFPAWLLPADDPYVATALGALHAIGLAATTSAYRFCTNAAYSAGVAGVPTIGFGPATEADAHVVDEHLALDDLEAAARGYQAIIAAVLS